MALLLHVQGTTRSALHPFDGHLVRNLRWERFDVGDITGEVDALVVSADDEESAEALVRLVRGSGLETPVLLRDSSETGHRLEGDHVATTGEDPSVMSLAVHLLLPDDFWSDRPVERTPSPPPVEPVIDLRRHVPRGGSRQLLRDRLGEAGAMVGASARAFDLRAPDPSPASSPDAPLQATPTASPEQSLSVAPTTHGAAAVPVVDVSSTAPAPAVIETDRAPEPSVDPGAPPRRGRDRRTAEQPDALIERLLPQVDRLYGVHETADAVAAHLRDVVVADAAAVLVPDGARWLMAGAVGHRHLEERLTVDEDHWLVAEVIAAHHGLIIEDTDIVRNRLAGAPLSAWPHLMAAPLRSVGGIALVARGEEHGRFTARDLTRATDALLEADPLFASAVRVRDLARLLSRFADLEDLELRDQPLT